MGKQMLDIIDLMNLGLTLGVPRAIRHKGKDYLLRGSQEEYGFCIGYYNKQEDEWLKSYHYESKQYSVDKLRTWYHSSRVKQ